MATRVRFENGKRIEEKISTRSNLRRDKEDRYKGQATSGRKSYGTAAPAGKPKTKPTGDTWEDTNALARRKPTTPTGATWEDTNALARGDVATPELDSYSGTKHNAGMSKATQAARQSVVPSAWGSKEGQAKVTETDAAKEAQKKARKEYMTALSQTLAAANLDPSSVTPEMQGALRSAEAAKNEAAGGATAEKVRAFGRGLLTDKAMTEGASEQQQKAFGAGAGIRDVVMNAPAIIGEFAGNAVDSFLYPNRKRETTGLEPEAVQKAARAGDVGGLAVVTGLGKASNEVAEAAVMLEDIATGGRWRDPLNSQAMADFDRVQQTVEEETKNWTDGQKQAFMYGTEAIRMVPSLIMAAMSGGATEAAALGPEAAGRAAQLSGALSKYITGIAHDPQFYLTAIQVTGDSYMAALDEGFDQNTAALFGTLNGILNGALEVGGIQDVPGQIAGKPLMSALLSAAKSVPTEIREEVTQGWVEKALENIVLGKGNKIISLKDPEAIISGVRALEEGKGAAILTAALGGGNVAINAGVNAYNRAAQNRMGGTVEETAPAVTQAETVTEEQAPAQTETQTRATTEELAHAMAPAAQTTSELNAPESAQSASPAEVMAQVLQGQTNAQTDAQGAAQTEPSAPAQNGGRRTAAEDYKFYEDDVQGAVEHFNDYPNEPIYEKRYHNWTWYIQKKSDGTYTVYAANNANRNGAFLRNEDVGEGFTSVEDAAKAAIDYCYQQESDADWNYWVGSSRQRPVGNTTQSTAAEVAEAMAPQEQSVQTQAAPQTEAVTPLAETILSANDQKVNIDNAENAPYITSEQGGVPNGGELDGQVGGTLQAESDIPSAGGRTPEGWDLGQGDLGVPSGNGSLTPEARILANDRGIVNVELHDSTADNASFSAALDRAKANDPKHGCSVDSHSAEDLDASGTKTWLSGNGMSGVAVEQNGNITGVFNDPQNPQRGTIYDLMLTAIENGGKMLDCFVVDGPMNLSRIYSKFGMEPVAWMKFDHATWQKYHPGETWNFDTMGEPIVVFFAHNGDSVSDIINNMGSYQYYSSEDIQKNFPELTDYDDGIKYQQAKLAEVEQKKNGNNTPAPPAPPVGPSAPDGNGTLGIRPEKNVTAEDGSKPSQTVETAQAAEVTTDEFSELINQEKEKGGFRYMPLSNDESTQRATEKIKQQGWSSALTSWSNDVQKGKSGAEMTAMGALLYNNAVNSGDTKLAMQILGDYAMLGRNTAQGLQAFQILKTLTPTNQLYAIENQLAKLSEQLKGKLPEGVTLSEELKEAYMNATTDEARDAVLDQMMQDVANQIPATFKDKWTALRYMNMLGNFRTQGRNIIGNTLMAGTTATKNLVLRGLEGIAKAVNPNYERTVSLTADPALYKEAMQEFKENAKFISGESKYADNTFTGNDFMQGVQDKRKIFNFAPAEIYRKATTFATEAGDRIFIGPRYARSLAGYLQANGMDAQTYAGIRNGSIQPTPEQQALLDRARTFAMKDAQESTFHDSNWLSDWVSKIGRRPGTKTPIRILSEGLMPFRKTPANVAMRMAEYSPIGLVEAAYKTVRSQTKGDVSSQDILNTTAKGMTGTGLFLLGMLLRSSGRLRGHEDDEKQSAFDSLRGAQDYSLVFDDGSSVTMDWASPVASTVFMGSQLYDLIQEGGFQLEDLGEMFTRLTDPLIQMSMLQGVNDAMENLRYSNNSLGQVALNMGLSYLTQGLTNSMLGQAERTAEDRRYTTFRDSTTPFGRNFQQTLGKASAKTPGFDFNQIEYVDAWGRTEDTGNPFARAVNNFLNPGFVSSDNSTPVDDELQRLYDSGFRSVFPQRRGMTEKISTYDANGKRTGERSLTADEYVTYQKTKGQTSLKMVQALMNSPVYEAMSDDAKAKAISDIYKYAGNQAARAVEPSTKNDYEEISNLSDPAAYYGAKAAFDDATGNRFDRDYEAVEYLVSGAQDLPDDVLEHLYDKKPELEKVSKAYEAGCPVRVYYHAADAVKDLEPLDGSAGVKSWQKYQAVLDSVMDTKQADILMETYMQDGTYMRYQTARAGGIKPQFFVEAYRAYTENNTRKGAFTEWMKKQGYNENSTNYMYAILHGNLGDLSGLNDKYNKHG